MPPVTKPLVRGPAGPNGSGRPPKLDRSRLLATRRGAIAVATVAGLAALAVLLVFMSNYRHSLRSGNEPVHVLVASRQLDSGTSGEAIAEAELFESVEMRSDEAEAGALTSVAALHGKHTTTTIDKNEQLTAADFAKGSDPIAGRLAGVERALTVPVETSRGNIGKIKVGSRVDVLGGYNAEVSGGRARPSLDILARDVLVLAVPASASGSGIGSSNDKEATLRLSDREAARVGYAAENGKVWLAIRPPTLAKDSGAGSGGGAGE
jgi:Flp pilus assembly protein CpaB